MNIEEIFLKLALMGAQWVLWVLVGLSVVCLAIMIERTVTFVRLSSGFEAMYLRLRELLRRDDMDGALTYLEKRKGVEAVVAEAGLREADRGPAAVEETMLGVRMRERLGLEKNLSFLGTVGSNAPFIGLFGTVLGIIKAFHSLAGAHSANFKVVMADISEALVATGVGLLVAIPAVVAFNIFSRRARRISTNTEAMEHLVLAQLKGDPLPTLDDDSAEEKRARQLVPHEAEQA